MLSGVVDNESLPAVLQSVGQRRRTGELELNSPKFNGAITFLAGRIADYKRDGESPGMRVFLLLQDAGVIAPEKEFRGESIEELRRDLSDLALPGRGPHGTLLKRAIRKRLIDGLLEYELPGPMTWSFTVAGTAADRDSASSLSVSQLLILKSEAAALLKDFYSIFDPLLPIQQGSVVSGLSEEQQILLENLTPGIRPSELEARSLLPTVQFHEAALQLLRTGVIVQKTLKVNASGAVAAPTPSAAISSQVVSEPTSSAAVSLPSQSVVAVPRGAQEQLNRVAQVMALLVVLGTLSLALLLWEGVLSQF